MGLIQTIGPVQYLESDGKPIGETDLHIEWMIRIRDILRWRYHQQRVYVGSNLLLYYVEGEPTKFVVPDIFVVLNSDPGRRRTFKTWEEGKVPDVMIEVTSKSTRRDDEVFKLETYCRLGIAEYFVYDPTGDYLAPALQGFRLAESGYQRIPAGESVALACERLSMTLRLQGDQLILSDTLTGAVLLTEAEAERRRADEQQERALALEREVERLREELRRREKPGKQ